MSALTSLVWWGVWYRAAKIVCNSPLLLAPDWRSVYCCVLCYIRWRYTGGKSTVTADTLYVHVPDTRVGKPSIQVICLHFVHNKLRIILVFHSTQNHTTVYGYATNWTCTSWQEIYPKQRKFNMNFWQAVSWRHQDNVTVADHIYFYIKSKFIGIFVNCENIISLLALRLPN
jgi:hypothetical protein